VVYSRQAVAALRQRVDVSEPPLGIRIGLPGDPSAVAFPWSDYRAVLAYLRTQTGPDTRVANLVHVVPALNGPAGRLTPLPAESLAWMAVAPAALEDFARALDAAPANSVVVWSPEKGGVADLYLHYDDVERLAPVIRRHYAPAARFGALEVWARQTAAAPERERAVAGPGG
jgi:hypothetical protein